MQDENSQLSRIISYEQMNASVDQNQMKKSRILREELQTKTYAQLDEFGILLKKVAQQMESRGKPVIMTEKSTVRSQISLRTLIGGFMDDIVKVQETISDYDTNCPFSYSQLQDPEEFQKFCAWYKIKTATQTGLDPNSIVIHCVAKGSIKVEWSTNQSYVLDAAFVQKPELKKRLKLHHFFENFQLSPEDFDPRGNIQFDQQRFDILQRGGWPYYQPVKCKRYGINVSGKYDNGNDRWLSMGNRPGEWAVAFHAVRTPKRRISSGNRTILESIMSGIDSNAMLNVGVNNYYQDDIPVNNPQGQKIGKGIYCSPHIQQTFPYTCDSSEEYWLAQRQYGLVFQCRVNPKEIKVTRNNVYWVINHSKDIRPYGIILIKREIFKDYPSVIQQFRQPFKYDNFKDYIEDFQKQM